MALSFSTGCIFLAILSVALCTVRNGNSTGQIPVVWAVFLADFLAILGLYSRRNMTVSLQKSHLVIVALAFAGIVFQRLAFPEYFSFGGALQGVILFSLFLFSTGLIVPREYGKLLFKIINTINMLGTCCIILQMACKLAGIRLDRMGLVSALFFNGWEFTLVFRPCGIFAEPSHFAEMVLLSVFYYLYIEKSVVRLCLITVAVLLSTSSLGIIGIALLCGIKILWFTGKERMSPGVKAGLLALCGAVVAGILLFWQKRGSENWLLNRILSGGSFSVRVLRSFEIFWRMDWLQKLIGLGVQNQERFLNFYGIILPSDTYETAVTNREFAQTLGYILCTMGIVGFTVFLVPFLTLFKKGSGRVRTFVVLFFYLCGFCCVFSRSIFLLYGIVLYALAQGEKEGAYGETGDTGDTE